MTLTARPASGPPPGVVSACFIRMPGTFEMPPPAKSVASVNGTLERVGSGQPLIGIAAEREPQRHFALGHLNIGNDHKLTRLPQSRRECLCAI